MNFVWHLALGLLVSRGSLLNHSRHLLIRWWHNLSWFWDLRWQLKLLSILSINRFQKSLGQLTAQLFDLKFIHTVLSIPLLNLALEMSQLWLQLLNMIVLFCDLLLQFGLLTKFLDFGVFELLIQNLEILLGVSRLCYFIRLLGFLLFVIICVFILRHFS